MRLHHYTDAWPQIHADGAILANWRSRLAHLSTSDDPAGLPGSLRGSRYRITVDIPDAEIHSWVPWAHANLDPREARTLTAARLAAIPTPDEPTPGRPEEWVVVTRDIPRSEWLWVVDLRSPAVVWYRA